MKTRTGFIFNSPDLILNTSRSRIAAEVYLSRMRSNEASYPGTHGVFAISAQTVHSTVNISFPVAPPLSTLYLGARTRKAPVEVALHHSYEGSLALSTSPESTVQITRPELTPKDPTGEGREWTLRTHDIRNGSVEGEVYYDRENQAKGRVKVQTEYDECSLSFLT